jgi:peptidoglycan/xylan/chitin deacetylase (PgdA/CDA1 family)
MIARAATRSVAGLLASGAGSSRLIVLHYHRVLEAPDPMFTGMLVERAAFAEQMAALAEYFRVLPLSEALARLRQGDLPRRAVAVTFDDGYADNFHVAMPILQQFGLTATFFVATDYLDGGCMFNDMIFEACRHAPAGAWDTQVTKLGTLQVTAESQRPALALSIIGKLRYLDPEQRLSASRTLLDSTGARPPLLMMTSREIVKAFNAGMEIGAHTASHPILATLSDAEARREIEAGRNRLESLLGAKVPLFAYPNGVPGTDYSRRDVELVRQLGFAGAVTTAPGCAGRRADRFQIPRIGTWDPTRTRTVLRLLACYALNRRYKTI